jgi:hypothetical protein
MFRLNTRLNKIEKRLDILRRDAEPTDPRSGAEWLAAFKELGRRGYFDGEPDFPVALGVFRTAVAASGPDAWDLKEWDWLAEMYMRVSKGKPPVTQGEFDELVRWFRKTESMIDGVIDMGDGRRVSRASLTYQIQKGPRAGGVTELVEDLRRIREVLG